MSTQFHVCKPGSESWCARELGDGGAVVGESGSGWVRCSQAVAGAAEHSFAEGGLCFAILSIFDAVDLRVASLNAQAASLCRLFWDANRGLGIEAPWHLWVSAPADRALARRAAAVAAAVQARLQRQAPRVARLAVETTPAPGVLQGGLAVHFLDFDHLVAGVRFCHWGPRRMRDNTHAPSRSYLKVEEAYAVLGQGPMPGQVVVDLGAAPGGWSFSAAERGAEVIAVDNGPLKGGARDNPRIRHLRDDAFRFRPGPGEVYDWLFCDVIEEPHRILRDVLVPWVKQGWCRAFVVNLKVGRADPLEVLRHVRDLGPGGLARHCGVLRVRQLYHDREEITCMGCVVPEHEPAAGAGGGARGRTPR